MEGYRLGIHKEILINFNDKINISISLGLETNNKLNENIDLIIEQADKNMYADKARLKKS